jgi:excisionase family DNA binding protein
MRHRRAVTEIEKQREALSLRGVEREYGLSRTFVADLVRDGTLPGLHRGRAIRVLRIDVEAWWREQASRPVARAQAAVEKRLEREAARSVNP